MSNDEEIGGGGGYDRTMKTALYVARMIHHDLVFANARSWQWWRAIGGDYKDGLLFRYRAPSAPGDTIVDSKLLWALGNYSFFIHPGAKRLELRCTDKQCRIEPDECATQPYGLMSSAYRNNDGQLVVVVINYAPESKTAGFTAPTNKHWKIYRTSDNDGESLKYIGDKADIANITFPPRSITTLVTTQD